MKRPTAARPANISGPRIRATRLRLRPPMSQAELVRRVNRRGFNFDSSIMSRIESQRRGVMDVELQAIARCLKTTIARLCGERGA